jgi:chromosome segregation ATPase
MMSRANKALVVLIVAALGLWGCAQGPAHNGERVKGLEAKVAKLEEDFKAATTARDQVRKKLADVEEQRNKSLQEAEQQQQALTKEREELKQQLTTRTTERDTVQTQFEVFRKELHNLMQQVDTAASGMNPVPAVSSSEPVVPGKS